MVKKFPKKTTQRWRRLCRKKYKQLIEPLRARAEELGYALGVHGTIARDIDLIAVPWTSSTVGAKELSFSLRDVAREINGYCEMSDLEKDDEYFKRGSPGHKPHGRLVWSWHLGGGPYLDLSVLPIMDDPWPEFEIIEG